MFRMRIARRGVSHPALAALVTGLVLAIARPALGQGRPAINWMAGGHSGGIASMALSPDNQSLATASFDTSAKLFDVPTSMLRFTLVGHDIAAMAVDYSPDGAKVVTGGQDGQVIVWDASTGTAKVWNAATGGPIGTLSGHSDWVYSVAFSPDSATIASGSGDSTIRLWRVSDGAHIGTLTGHTGFVLSVCFSPAGDTLVSSSNDDTSRLWRLSDGVEIGTYTGQTLYVYSAIFSPDGSRVASGAGDGSIVIRTVSDGAVERTIALPVGVLGMTYASDGSAIYAGCDDSTVSVWNTTDGTFQKWVTAHFGPVTSVAVSPDGSLSASGSNDYTVRLHSMADGHTVGIIAGHTDGVTSVAFSGDGTLVASASYDGTAAIWQVSDGAPVRTLSGHTDSVTAVAFSPDGLSVATGSADTTIKLWQVSDGTEIGSFSGHYGDVMGLAFSPDGTRLASAGADGTVRCWTVADRSQVWSQVAASGWVLAVAFSPDGLTVASGSADSATGTLNTFSAADGAPIATSTGHTDPVRSVAYSPDGLVIASGGDHNEDGRLQFRLASNLGLLQTYDRETGSGSGSYGVTSVAYSPNRAAVVYGRSDATLVSCANPFWPVPTTLTVEPVAGQIGEIVTLKADLTVSVTGAPILGKPVAFTVAGTAVGMGETDLAGRAECDFRVSESLGISEQTIGASFAGDDAYTAADGTATLTITRANTGLTADRVAGVLGDTVTLSATLIRTTDDSPLSGRTITFRVESVNAGSAVTDAAGVASVDFAIPLDLGAGNRTITVSFAGDVNHLECTGYGTLVTSKRPTSIAVLDTSSQIGAAAILEATLTFRGTPIEGATVGFTMDGTELGLVLTDAEGVARTGYIVPEGAGVGERVIGAEYAGDEVYDRSSGTGALTVLRTDTRAYVPDLMRTGSVGLDVVLRGYLYRATDRAGVMGRTMTFTVDGTPAGSAVTIDTGRATAYYTLPAESESGIVVVRAEFAGDATYGASADEGLLTLTVQRLSTIMWVLPRIVLPDTNTYLRAYLRRTSDYSWLPDKPVAISLDGTEVGTALTDSGGRASILYHVPADYQTGEHTITATFAGDDEFFGSTADGWMLVL